MGRGRSQKSLALVQLAREILEEIQPASVRAVCYQLFTRGAIPSMRGGGGDRARVDHADPHDVDLYFRAST
jgi:hypothetical protein